MLLTLYLFTIDLLIIKLLVETGLSELTTVPPSTIMASILFCGKRVDTKNGTHQAQQLMPCEPRCRKPHHQLQLGPVGAPAAACSSQKGLGASVTARAAYVEPANDEIRTWDMDGYI